MSEPLRTESTSADQRVTAIAQLLKERIVPYDAWWYDNPKDVAAAIVELLDGLSIQHAEDAVWCVCGHGPEAHRAIEGNCPARAAGETP